MNTYWFNEIFSRREIKPQHRQNRIYYCKYDRKQLKNFGLTFHASLTISSSLTTFSGDLPHTQVRSGCCFLTKAILFFGVKEITDQWRIKNHLDEIVVNFEGQMNCDFRGLMSQISYFLFRLWELYDTCLKTIHQKFHKN